MEPELTELFDLEVDRHDGVASPASGFSFLVTKSAAAKDVNSVGGINEKPDIAGADQVLCLLYKLVESEAREGAAGADESCDINLLSEAISLIKWFRANEQAGDEDDGHDLAKSEAEWFTKAHRKFSSDERKKLAGAGHALPDGSYPIPDEDALRRAAILARSGHGDVAAAKKLIARRAKELGVRNPLAEEAKKNMDNDNIETSEVPPVADATKDAPAAPEVTAESVQELIKAALAERDGEAESLRKELAEAKSALDVLKATPIPGGPAISATAEQRAFKVKNEAMQKAAYYRRLAESVNDRELAVEYRNRARAAEAEAA